MTNSQTVGCHDGFLQIDKISELEKLKGLPVETLFFEGNPLVEQLTTASGYLRSIARRINNCADLPFSDFPSVVSFSALCYEALFLVVSFVTSGHNKSTIVQTGTLSGPTIAVVLHLILIDFSYTDVQRGSSSVPESLCTGKFSL